VATRVRESQKKQSNSYSAPQKWAGMCQATVAGGIPHAYLRHQRAQVPTSFQQLPAIRIALIAGFYNRFFELPHRSLVRPLRLIQYHDYFL
jgi:hypothetical protein